MKIKTQKLAIETELLVIGGVMFFVSLVYSTKGNYKWLLFMILALVLLYIPGIFIGVIGFEVLSPQLLKNMTIAQFFDLGSYFANIDSFKIVVLKQNGNPFWLKPISRGWGFLRRGYSSQAVICK